MQSRCVCGAVLLFSAVVLSAGTAGAAADLDESSTTPSFSVFNQPTSGISGILDPSKLDVSHSLSMSFSSSSSSRALPGEGFLGYYENRMSYQLADALNVTLYLGYQFRPTAAGMQGTDGAAANKVLPGFALTYKPGDNFLMQFSYRKVGSTSLYGASPFSDRYLLHP